MKTTTYSGTKSTTTISASKAARLERKIAASKNREAREEAKAEKLAEQICIAQQRVDDLVNAQDMAQGNAREAHARTRHLTSGCHECGHPFGLDEGAGRMCIMVPGTERLDDDGAPILGTGDHLRTEDGNWALRCDPCHAASRGTTLKAYRAEQKAERDDTTRRALAGWARFCAEVDDDK